LNVTVLVGIGLPGTVPIGGATVAERVTEPPEAEKTRRIDETVMVGTGLTVTVIVPVAPVEALVAVTVIGPEATVVRAGSTSLRYLD